MAGYPFLQSVTVVEVAQLGMDALGGHLADMGARVIKVEAIPDGDPVRFAGEHAIGGPGGVGFLHLRWNRGKDSIGIDLRKDDGQALFKQLVGRADILVEGLKGGALERLGLGPDTLRALNPALVHCSISGLGRSGPYHQFRSHAVAYEAFAGLLSKTATAPPAASECKPAAVGMQAPGLYGAIAVLAALLRARETGVGAFLELAAADAAANLAPDGVDTVANADKCVKRPGFADASGRMLHWPRLWHYETADGRTILLEALADPTWGKFCAAVDRADLLALHDAQADDLAYHQRLKAEIAAILRTRDLSDWMTLFAEHDVSAMPVNDLTELTEDGHYQARGRWYDQDYPGVGSLRLTSTPVIAAGEAFRPAPAPLLGEQTDAILEGVLGLDAGAIAHLRLSGTVG